MSSEVQILEPIPELLINEIARLGKLKINDPINVDVENQLLAVKDEICTKIFPGGRCVDKSVIKELLPLFVNFLKSGNAELQKDCAYLIMAIVCPTNDEYTLNETEALVKTDGILSSLIELLSSTEASISEQAIMSLRNISFYFSINILDQGVLLPLVECMKRFNKDEKLQLAGAQLLQNLTSKCPKKISQIIDAGAIEILMNLLEARKRNVGEEALQALINIISYNSNCCQAVLDHYGALNIIKKLLKCVYSYQILAVEFIEKMTSHGEKQIDDAIEHGFIKFIVKELKGVDGADMKVKCIHILQHIITHRPEYFIILIQKEDIISVLMNNIKDSDFSVIMNNRIKIEKLTILVLSTLNSAIQAIGYDTIEQKLKICNGKRKLQKLLQHENTEIQGLATAISELVGSEPETRSRRIVAERIAPSDERSTTTRCKPSTDEPCRKRLMEEAKNKQHFTRSKRSKISLEHLKTEPSVSPVDNDDNDGYHDFDNPSRNSSPMQLNIASIEEGIGNSLGTPLVSSPSPVNQNILPDLPMPSFNPQNQSTFSAFKYCEPSKDFIKSCCDKLGLTFDRQKYHGILSKINFSDDLVIRSSSQPATFLPTTDKSGFGCFSVFLAGEEKDAEKIRDQTRMKFSKDMFASKVFDQQKLMEIGSDTLTDEHLKTIAAWFECRIMVYSNETWKLFGEWVPENIAVPVFILQKDIIDNEIVYKIVSSMKD